MSQPLQRAVDLVGLSKLARGLGVRYQSVLGWIERGRLPRTEWTGETKYAETIERLTDGQVTRDELLQIPPEQGQARQH